MHFTREFCLALKVKSSLMRSGLFRTLMMFGFCHFFFYKIVEVFFFLFFYREAVDAGRKFHGKDKIKDKS